MDKCNHSTASSTNWIRIVGIVVGVLTVAVLAMSSWAFATSGQVRENTTIISILRDNHTEMKEKIDDLWEKFIEKEKE